jgi:hypothetical protein
MHSKSVIQARAGTQLNQTRALFLRAPRNTREKVGAARLAHHLAPRYRIASLAKRKTSCGMQDRKGDGRV